MKKVLVTGGTGYIGSHTVVELLSSGYDVDIVDNLSNSKASVVDAIEKIVGRRPGFYELDLLDRQAVDGLLDDNYYDYVLHFAGLKVVGESISRPLDYYRENIDSTINLVDSMLSHDVGRLIFSSSAAVYGKQDSPMCTENMRAGIGITSPYGKTKYMIEEVLRDVCVANPNFSVTALRYFNPIGNHPSGLIGEDPVGMPNNLMIVVMRVARGIIPELKVYGNDYDTKDGTGERDFIHVVDLAKGHIAAMDHMAPGMKIFNLGSGRPTTVLELLTAFERISGKPLPHSFAPRRDGDLGSCWASPSLANDELGWKTRLSIDDAVRDTLVYLSKNKK